MARASKALHEVEQKMSKAAVSTLDEASETLGHFRATGDAFVTFERAEDAIKCREHVFKPLPRSRAGAGDARAVQRQLAAVGRDRQPGAG